MTLNKMPEDPDAIRKTVSDNYAKVAQRSQSCCGPSTSCCSPEPEVVQIASRLGYSSEQLEVLPDEANLGLGCGNPTAIDSLSPGEVVVDLGSGAGIDVFLAAKEVGPTGQVIGVDMTDAMLEKARKNASQGGYENVEFRKGKIEELPIEDESVDVIISNCVINLSPEKDKVFREAYRVLKPGGRMMISDIVLEKELPREIMDRMETWVACVGGASLRRVYLQTVQDAGFSEIRVEGESNASHTFAPDNVSKQSLAAEYGVSADEVGDVLESITSLQLLVRK